MFNNSMTLNCEIITEFKIEQFKILRNKFNLDNTLFCTSNIQLFNDLNQLGFDVENLQITSGTIKPEINQIYEHAVNLTSYMKNSLNFSYKDVQIFYGLKDDIQDAIILLEIAKNILEKKTKNVIFLFPDQKYFYFAIEQISKKLNYNTTFGVSTIVNSEFISIDFSDTFTKNCASQIKSSQKILNVNNLDYILIIEEFFKNSEKSNFGFFFDTTQEDFYTKPVYPVLSKFSETHISYTIFSWNTRTSDVLKSHGLKHVNLFELDQQRDTSKSITSNMDILYDFFQTVEHLKKLTDNIVLNSFLNFLKNDRIVLDILDIFFKIDILKILFKHFQFKSILVAADGTMSNSLVCDTSKNYDIPTFSIIPGISTFYPIFKTLYTASKLFLSGNEMKNGLKNLQLDETRLIVTGNPKYDYVKQLLGSNQLQKKTIIVANSRIHHNDEEWMSELIKYCNNNSIKIIIKFHPTHQFSADTYSIIQDKLQKIKNTCIDLDYEITFNSKLEQLLASATILITDYSSVGIEAALSDIPIITVNLFGENYEYFPNKFYEKGIALYAENTDELFKNIERILNDNNVNIELSKAREKFNYEFNYLNDGKAAERIFQILTNFYHDK